MRRVIFFLNPLLVDRRDRRAVAERCAARLRADGCAVEMQDTISDALQANRHGRRSKAVSIRCSCAAETALCFIFCKEWRVQTPLWV